MILAAIDFESLVVVATLSFMANAIVPILYIHGLVQDSLVNFVLFLVFSLLFYFYITGYVQ